MKTLTNYQKTILRVLKVMNRLDVDPRHIEGYMRLQYSTLDHLSLQTFIDETKLCIGCIDYDGKENAEKNALSYGL